ncbi:MAG: hypothetical protein Q7S64_00420 [bacterium]|nr:hypothetical protein [bacterium]
MNLYAIGWRCRQEGADTNRRVTTPLGEFGYDSWCSLPIEKVEGPVYLDLANERVALDVLELLRVLTELLAWSWD